MVLLDAVATTDPLALMIGGGAACVSALAMLVWSLLLSRVTRMEKDLKELNSNLIGTEGTTIKITRLEGRMANVETRLTAQETGTLSLKIFELATRDQNARLEELKYQTQDLDRKVDKIDRALPQVRHDSPPPRAPGRPFK